MKGLIVDASVAGAWVLHDEQSETADSVLEQMQAGVPAFVPSLWPLEMANLIFGAERRKRFDRKQRDDALDHLERISVTILPGPTLSSLRTIRLYIVKHQLTAYDAEYLRVAKENDLTLASLDRNLLAAAKREKVPAFVIS